MSDPVDDKWEGLGPVGSLLTDFSPSRLSTVGQCGRKFEYSYVRGIPQPYDKGALLLGTAVHNGVQAWYELPDDGFKTQDLAPVICAQWPELLPPAVWDQLTELRELDAERDNVAAAILFSRPQLKSPTTTVAFLSSKANRAFQEAQSEMLLFCDRLPDVKWPKDEDPYKAYKLAAQWGENMQRRWQGKPRPAAVEVAFVVELFGFRVRGRIDQVRVDPLPPYGEAFPAVVDIKSGKKPLTQMEAFLQMYVYHRAVEEAVDLPATADVALYLTRKDAYQQGRIDRSRHDRLASQILNARAIDIATGNFAPSFGFWCHQCDFRDMCQTELSLWKGDDGMVMELMA